MEGLRRLWRHDLLWRWFLSSFLVLVFAIAVPQRLLPIDSINWRLWLAPVAAGWLAFGWQRLEDRPERRFWGWLVVAFGCWAIGSWWSVLVPRASWGPASALFVDGLVALHYTGWLLALAFPPDAGEKPPSRSRLLRSAATALLVAGLTVYFTVIPVRESVAPTPHLPSFDLHVVLDLLVVTLLVRVWLLADSPRWRTIYGFLTLTTVGFGLGDLASASSVGEHLPPPLVGLLDALPFLPLIAAARLRHLSWPRIDRDDQTSTAPRHRPSPITLAALVLPLVHILGHRWALFDPIHEATRERWVLICLIVLGVLASIENLWLRRAARRAEQAKAEARELRLGKAVAERSQRAKSQFLASISHEIRTPMAGIIGLSRVLLDSRLPDQGRHYAELLQTSARGLLHTVDRLLDYSTIEAGRWVLSPAPFDLRPIALGLIDELSDEAESKGLTLRCELAEAVPERLVGDADRLRQVLGELLQNAVKFTETGEVRLVVRRAAPEELPEAEAPVSLHFVVEDSGIGIPQSLHTQLFRPFAQEDPSASRRFGGTGLGLALCQRIVQGLGGTIRVDSRSGDGARFRVVLPFEEPAS